MSRVIFADTRENSFPYYLDMSDYEDEYSDESPSISQNTRTNYGEQITDKWPPEKDEINRQTDEGFRTVSKQCRLIRNRQRCRPRSSISRKFDIYQEDSILSPGNGYKLKVESIYSFIHIQKQVLISTVISGHLHLQFHNNNIMFNNIERVIGSKWRATNSKQQAQERQDFITPIVGGPFVAAAVPAAAAAALGVYGTYQQEINDLLSSLLGKSV